jgi:flagellar hook assembly protein FlgD
VTDYLPAHLIFGGFGPVPAGVTTNWIAGTRVVQWALGDLPVGAVTLTYQAMVDSYVQQGSVLTNNAQVTSLSNPVPKKASVDVTMAKIYTVKLAVYNEAGELVKSIWVQELSQQITDFDLNSATITSLDGKVYVEVKGAVIASWDGTNQGGDPVSNGEYYVKVDNVDPFGVVNSVSQMVKVNRSIAKVQVQIYNEAGEIVRHLYSYVNDPSGAPMTSMSLSSSVIKPTADTTPDGAGTNVVNITTPNGVTLVWDGRGDNGAVVTNGRYEVAVYYTDGKGGQEAITQAVTVESTNTPSGYTEIYAAPNVLKAGVTTTTVKVKTGMSLTVGVKLYDVAGELVKTLQGQAGADQAALDAGDLASGLYFAIVDLTDAQGRLIGKKTLQIVIQR